MSIFNKISLRKPKRSRHNLSYSSKFSLPFGKLVPIMCEKVVPGDKFSHGHEFIMRFAPFVSQVFQSFQVRTEYFFVPSRLLWSNFEKFLIEDDATIYPHPSFDFASIYNGSEILNGSLFDYFNLPTCNYNSDGTPSAIDGTSANMGGFDCLPFAAYLKIFLDYYADENLLSFSSDIVNIDFQGFVDLFEDNTHSNGFDYSYGLKEFFASINNAMTIADGQTIFGSTSDIFSPFTRAYPKDYFTSALPWAQRGPIVQIPLNGQGDVKVYAENHGVAYQGVAASYQGTPAGTVGEDVEVTLYTQGVMDTAINEAHSNVGGGALGVDKYVGVFGQNADTVSQARTNLMQGVNGNTGQITFKAVNVNGTATITDLRTAMAVQSWLEKNARAGVRYKEQLASHFGVRSRDYRLDRAELLQSSRNTVHIGEVFTTAQNDDGTFVPGLGVSTATGAGAVKPWKHYFEEHGYVIGLMTVYPKAAYSQGMPHQFLELDKFDYFWPEFQHIGEQEIKNCELFINDEAGEKNMQTFGYTPRYAQYKSRQSQIHADFRGSLNTFTASRLFGSAPSLNMDFINIIPDKNALYRVFNATGSYSDSFPVFVDMFHNFKAVRPMSYFGTPRIF